MCICMQVCLYVYIYIAVVCTEPYQSGPDQSCHLVVSDRKLNFEEAEEFCRRSDAQAHLVNPENEERGKLLQSIFTQLTGGIPGLLFITYTNRV